MKNTRSTIVLGALALALGLTGCGRAPAEASGQSDYFRALDSNHDGSVVDDVMNLGSNLLGGLFGKK